jgi:hypothetical protein
MCKRTDLENIDAPVMEDILIFDMKEHNAAEWRSFRGGPDWTKDY